jgi:hypothetical protein
MLLFLGVIFYHFFSTYLRLLLASCVFPLRFCTVCVIDLVAIFQHINNWIIIIIIIAAEQKQYLSSQAGRRDNLWLDPWQGKRFISLRIYVYLRSFQIGSRAHPTSYPIGTGSKADGGGGWNWPFTSL